MFFQEELSHKISLPPKSLVDGVHNEVHKRLKTEKEGTCHGYYGFIICISNIKDIGPGYVQGEEDKCSVSFEVKYEAIVLRPFKGEVIDAYISLVSKVGVFANVGPLEIYVSKSLIPKEFQFATESGEACFVYYDNNTTLCGNREGADGDDESYTEMESRQEQKLIRGTCVRIKIIAVKIRPSLLTALGTINDSHLGII